ncbi:MAG: hypothetical protein ABI411_20220 [Tahibacter sp.]
MKQTGMVLAALRQRFKGFCREGMHQRQGEDHRGDDVDAYRHETSLQ